VRELDGFTDRMVPVDGARLHVVVGGDGPFVLLVHGWPFTWREWVPTMPLLAERGFTVAAVDLRGLGDSDVVDEGFSLGRRADDLHRVVRELGHDDVRVVGTDIGTMVAHRYATDHPAEVTRLVLTESAIPGLGLEPLMDVTRGGSWHFGFHAQVELADTLTAGREEQYLTPFWSLMTRGRLAPEERDHLLRSYSRPGRMRAGFRHYETLVADGRENAARAERLTMPVLVLNGDHGLPQQPLLAGVRQIADHVEHDLVPDAAHVIATDNPAWLARRLVQFFA
jgi:pimeloyl-ACP methyl ester carboxylesterase